MTRDEVARELNLPEGIERNGEYVIILNDSGEYSKAYTKLDSSNSLDLVTQDSVINEHTSTLYYVGNFGDTESMYDIILDADFDEDIYKVTIR